jgi:hypothetical protein
MKAQKTSEVRGNGDIREALLAFESVRGHAITDTNSQT